MFLQLVTMLLTLASLAIFASAQEPRSIAISVFAARRSDSPLRVSGFSSGSNIPKGGRSMVQSVSQKPISEFMLEALVGAACPKDGSRSTIGIGRRLESIDIPPHSTAQSMETILDPGLLVTLAKQFNTAYLHIEVAVAEVRFQDASVWKSQSPMVFDTRLLESDSDRCANWATPASALKPIITTVYTDMPAEPEAGAKLAPQGSGIVGYFMTCAIRGTKAYCPKN